jgi:hypothetical protein
VAIEDKATSMLQHGNEYAERIKRRADFYGKLEEDFKKAIADDVQAETVKKEEEPAGLEW